MADINYPKTLPQFILGKSREQQQGYRVNDVFAGSPFVEKITDDKPVKWSGEVFCKNNLISRSFQQFIKLVSNGKKFNMPILTENGFVTHEVFFFEEPNAPVQVNQSIWRYSFTILARELINPDDEINNPELIANWLLESSIIDVACNSSWPEA